MVHFEIGGFSHFPGKSRVISPSLPLNIDDRLLERAGGFFVIELLGSSKVSIAEWKN